jgi:glycosyltransferase involved in cell wall biosynthesis
LRYETVELNSAQTFNAGMANAAEQKARAKVSSKGRRICMLSYSDYQSDARVTRYAETLAAEGDEVEVLSLRCSEQQPRRELLNGVTVIRIQSRLGKKEKSSLSFLWPILRFFVTGSIWIAREHVRERYQVLHIHNVPDFLVFAGWLPKITGSRIILDIHDIVPEFYGNKFKADETSLTVKALKAMEWASAKFANHVIISNDLWKERYARRTGAKRKCSVFINNVDGRVFTPGVRERNDGKQVVIFPGGLQWHQGLDIAIRAFQRVVRELPRAEFHIYGEGNMKDSLKALVQELDLEQKVFFFGPLPLRKVVDRIREADLGVVPKRADSFGNEAYSTKIMEFMALRVPVVASSTRIDRHYFNEEVVKFFESGNPEKMAEAMLEVLGNSELRSRMMEAGEAYARQHSWDTRKEDYLKLVDSLSS